jgi:hypothetical protein
MPFHIGDCFWVQTRLELVEHLWILVTDPNPINNSAIWVNVTTARLGSDRTKVLNPGDHPAIRHESVIFYSGAKLVDLTKLESLIQAGVARKTANCSRSLLVEIQAGLLNSKFTSKRIQNSFKAEKAAGRT